MADAIHGHPPDADALFRRWGGRLAALGRKWARYASPFDRAVSPEDVAQDIALAAVRRLPRYAAGRMPFDVWLALLARSVACQLRARALRPMRAAVVVGSTFPDGSDALAAIPDRKAVDPALAPAQPRDVFVPICDLGIGTGAAWVADARTGARVRIADAPLKLVGRGLCVPAVAFDEGEDGEWRVLLPDGATAWVRVAGG